MDDREWPPDLATDAESQPPGEFIERVRVAAGDGASTVLARATPTARQTRVDRALAAAIGVETGEDCDRPTTADVVIVVDGAPLLLWARIEDRSDRPYQVVIGRDLIDGYRVDEDRSLLH